MSRVYVGRLPLDARERDLDRFFKGYGRIREIIMKDGFAFVEFDDPRDADDAVHDLDGRDCAGSRVRVEVSRPRRGSGGYGGGGGRYGGYGGGYGGRYGGPPPRPRGSGYMAQRYGAPHRTRYQVRCENLSTRCSWQDLKDFMRQAGEVTYTETHKEKEGEGVCCFETERDMKTAIKELEGKELCGRRIHIVDDRTARSTSRSKSRSRSRSRSRSPRARSPSRSRRLGWSVEARELIPPFSLLSVSTVFLVVIFFAIIVHVIFSRSRSRSPVAKVNGNVSD